MASARRRSRAAPPGGAARRWRRWHGARERAAADPVRRQRPLSRGADRAASPTSPTPARRRGPRRGALLAELGPAALHAALAAVDPATAARLRPSDSQRIARAWEVWRGTGRGLAAWQAEPARAARRGASPRSCSTRRARRCARRSRRRFAAMLAGGRGRRRCAALLALGLDPGAAGDARAWRAGTGRPSARRDHAGGGAASRRAGHRPVHQAPGDLVPAPCAGRRRPARIRSMRGARVWRNFRKENMAEFVEVYSQARVDAPQRAPYACAP